MSMSMSSTITVDRLLSLTGHFHLSTIQSIDLSHHELNDGMISSSILPIIPQCTNLSTLNLSHNHLTSASISTLLASINTTQLHSLDLSYNQIHDINTLPTIPTLTSLYIHNNPYTSRTSTSTSPSTETSIISSLSSAELKILASKFPSLKYLSLYEDCDHDNVNHIQSKTPSPFTEHVNVNVNDLIEYIELWPSLVLVNNHIPVSGVVDTSHASMSSSVNTMNENTPFYIAMNQLMTSMTEHQDKQSHAVDRLKNQLNELQEHLNVSHIGDNNDESSSMKQLDTTEFARLHSNYQASVDGYTDLIQQCDGLIQETMASMS
jgi:hypothetical protein